MSLLQRILNAQHSGRSVDMPAILTHEISCVPLSLAKSDGTIQLDHKIRSYWHSH